MSLGSDSEFVGGSRAGRFAAGTFAPGSGAVSVPRMVWAQTSLELRLALRHPEQVFLTLVVPVLLMLGLTLTSVVAIPSPRIGEVTPAVVVVAVMSTAFTSQAISLAFDRRYGVLRRLASTALPRWLIVVGRLAAMFGVVAVQLVVLCVLALLLGWTPMLSGVGWALLLVVLGCAAFGSLGLLLGGTLRAEIVLAVANLVWFGLLLAGGIAVPVSALPSALAAVVVYLPSGALAGGLHSVLVFGIAPSPVQVAVLLGWAAVAAVAAMRTVRLR
jgi:ABC-2 type transport system permease protein